MLKFISWMQPIILVVYFVPPEVFNAIVSK